MFRFESLELLHLDDNRIEMLDSRSFVEMRNLKCLTLEGNKISKLEDETFQNLHSLRWLNLAYNSLTNLNFDAFDYVGSLSFTSLDLSHNKIENLTANIFTTLKKFGHGLKNLEKYFPTRLILKKLGF